MDVDIQLPHWACVALVARCARIVLPIFDKAWPDAPSEKRDSILDAISFAEKSAKLGQLDAEYHDVDFAVTSTCGLLRLYVYSSRGEFPELPKEKIKELPAKIENAVIASHAVAVAAKATETARADYGKSYTIAMEGLSWAIEITQTNENLLNKLRYEFESLQDTAQHNKWTHATPVFWTSRGWSTN